MKLSNSLFTISYDSLQFECKTVEEKNSEVDVAIGYNEDESISKLFIMRDNEVLRSFPANRVVDISFMNTNLLAIANGGRADQLDGEIRVYTLTGECKFKKSFPKNISECSFINEKLVVITSPPDNHLYVFDSANNFDEKKVELPEKAFEIVGINDDLERPEVEIAPKSNGSNIINITLDEQIGTESISTSQNHLLISKLKKLFKKL